MNWLTDEGVNSMMRLGVLMIHELLAHAVIDFKVDDVDKVDVDFVSSD